MYPRPTRLPEALEAALNLIRKTTTESIGLLNEALTDQAMSSAVPGDREQLIEVSRELQSRLGSFEQVFTEELLNAVQNVLNKPEPGTAKTPSVTDWGALSLVDDDKLEGDMMASRLAQQISHGADSDLRDLGAYIATLLGLERSEAEANPLRPEVLGQALYKALESVSPDATRRKLLVQQAGQVMSKHLAPCYGRIVTDFRSRGIQPAAMALVQTGARAPGSGQWSNSTPGALGSGQDSLSTAQGGLGPAMAGTPSGFGGLGGPDASMMSLLRGLMQPVAGGVGGLPGGALPAAGPNGLPAGADAAWATMSGNMGLSGADLGGLMALNLIHAHREELSQAAPGKLDGMVIDVVGSLFDQILSDTRIPPQMARELAKLQLPVLRVALRDNTFFSSRKHPVRRFINRIAALGQGFDDFTTGAGKDFLAQVATLIKEIIDGEFDQIDLYAQKLQALEDFAAAQARGQIQAADQAVELLARKETSLRTQQRYMLQLQRAFESVDIPAFLKEFLSQVWSQAIVQANVQFGEDSDQAKLMRRVGVDLVMSVQPKGAPEHRKKLVMTLPTLMRELTQGFALIGWPLDAQKSFQSSLLPAHAAALKAGAITDLAYNLMAKEVAAIFNNGLKESSGSADSAGPVDLPDATIVQQFTPAEAAQLGLVNETDVDLNTPIDIDVSDSGTDPAFGVDEAVAPQIAQADPSTLDTGLDINLDLLESDPAEPTTGADLIHHIQPGFTYRMMIQDRWQKVRLSHVSPGRSFYVFTYGKETPATVSFTHRMLEKMCANGRIRALESAYLLERATARARRQLASIKLTGRRAAA